MRRWIKSRSKIGAFLDTACDGDELCGAKLKRFWLHDTKQATS